MTHARPLRMAHWAIAILVTCQLAIAVVLTQLRSLAYGQLVLSLHRQLGLVILLLVVARFVLIRRQPAQTDIPSALPSWQQRAASLVHGAFYVLLVAQPVIGIFVAWARGDSVGLFGVAQVAAPFEISDVLRERLMTVHATTAMVLFALCLVHIGAVVFNSLVRRVSVIDRMLAPIPEDRLVNRIPIAAQLFLAFGLVIGTALLVGINAVATYRDLSRSTEAFQTGDVAVADQLRAAQVAWKDLSAAATTDHPDAAHVKDLEDSAKSSLEDAQTHAAGEIKAGLTKVIGQLADATHTEGAGRAEAIKAIDTTLQDLVDSLSVETLQHRTENDDKAARGHDLIVVTVLPMLLALGAWRKREVAWMAAGVLLINTPQYVRNMRLSGSPLGYESAQGDGFFRWRNERLGWRPLISNALRNTSEQLGARSNQWNRSVYNAVVSVHRALGLDPQDPDTTWRWTRYDPPRNANHESNANNRWHLLLIVAAAMWAAIKRDRRWSLYAAGLVGAFLLFCFYLKWQPFLARLELPLFVVSAVLVGQLVDGPARRSTWLIAVLSIFLVNNARPALFENCTRQLKGPRSLWTSARDDDYFRDISQWDNHASYTESVERVARSGCDLVGLDISRNTLEYPFQALLRERRPRVRFVHAGVPGTTELPCAVLCLDCAEDEKKLAMYSGVGAPIVIGRFLLFLKP